MTMKEMKERRTELEAAKTRLRRSMADASPSRLIEEHPLRATGIALALGAALGFSRAARGSMALLADMAAMTTGRAALRVLDLFKTPRKD